MSHRNNSQLSFRLYRLARKRHRSCIPAICVVHGLPANLFVLTLIAEYPFLRSCYNLLRSPFPAVLIPEFLLEGRFSPSSSSVRLMPIPNSNNFRFSDGSVFCAWDDIRGIELGPFVFFLRSSRLLTRVGFLSVDFGGMTRGFGLILWISVYNRACEQYAG